MHTLWLPIDGAARSYFYIYFFTTIPCTYNSSQIDGMDRNYTFYLHCYAKAHNLSCLDPFYSYLLIPEERGKTFSLSWNWTQVLLLHERPLQPLDHGSSGIFIYMELQHNAIFSVWNHFYPVCSYDWGEENKWKELGSNPRPFATQATALTTRPWLLGLVVKDSSQVWLSLFLEFVTQLLGRGFGQVCCCCCCCCWCFYPICALLSLLLNRQPSRELIFCSSIFPHNR